MAFKTPYGTLGIRSSEYVYESRLYIDDGDVEPVVVGLLNIPYAFSMEKSEVALVSISNGDNECPVSYRWVILNKKGYKVSPPFGSCSSQIKVWVQGRKLALQTPNPEKPDKMDTYVYDGKSVKKRTRP